MSDRDRNSTANPTFLQAGEKKKNDQITDLLGLFISKKINSFVINFFIVIDPYDELYTGRNKIILRVITNGDTLVLSLR